MPNQNQPDPNQNQQQNPGGSIPFSPQADLPPIPPEFQNIGNKPEKSGSAAPPVPDISDIISSPKKKFGTGKIIATILSILLVVGGVGAGTYLVGQKQIFNQKASGSCSGSCSTNGNCPEGSQGDGSGKNGGNGCDVGQYCCVGSGPTVPPSTEKTCAENGYTCQTAGSDGHCPTGRIYDREGVCNNGVCCDTPATDGNTSSWPPNGTQCQISSWTGSPNSTVGGCILYLCPNGCSGGCGERDSGVYSTNYSSCSEALSNLGSYCGQVDTINGGGTYCIADPSRYEDSKIQCSSCVKPPPKNRTSNPSSTPSPSPTGTPAAPYCVAVTTYSSDWTLISASARSSLTAGTTINFCVSGAAPSGTFDKARFTINGVLQSETTIQRPSSTDYCQSYTIPGGTTTFTVSAEIYHSSLRWF